MLQPSKLARRVRFPSPAPARKSKQSFFEKKDQKTFSRKRFLPLFFKKEVLPFYASFTHRGFMRRRPNLRATALRRCRFMGDIIAAGLGTFLIMIMAAYAELCDRI
jgi:hypothetical protein